VGWNIEFWVGKEAWAMDSIWQLLLTAIIGIITGAVVPLILQWRSKRAEAIKLTAESVKIEIDGKNIEDQITERVLERAKSHINGLSSENLNLKTQLEIVQREKEELAERVRQLEEKDLITQVKYTELLAMFNALKEGICLLCEQLNEVGIEPVFVIEEAGGD
jgi:chromosome segregation ATPase